MYTDTPEQMLKEFRVRTGDNIAPYFWSDREIFSYMSEGESVVAQRTLCIQDMSTDAARYEVFAGEADIAIFPSILRIRGAVWVENGQECYLEIDSLDAAIAQGVRLFSTSGRPRVLYTGSTNARLYPTPETAGELRLVIYRLPLSELECGKRFEVPHQLRPAIMEWMKFLAFKKNDAETFNRETSEQSLNAFEYLIDGYTTSESQRRNGPQNISTGYGGL
jgi:hypothetical protein